jgi:hypothetical protein
MVRRAKKPEHKTTTGKMTPSEKANERSEIKAANTIIKAAESIKRGSEGEIKKGGRRK